MNTRELSPEAPEHSATPTLRAGKLVGGGRALTHHAGRTWMVAGALPGEKVAARVTARRAGIVEAQVVEVVQDRHPARIADPCPHSPVCGGCDWPHVDPEAGARLKASAAAEAARRFPAPAARLVDAEVRSSPLGYRLRARLHWDPAQRQLGFYAARTRAVTAIGSCRILSPRLMAALQGLTAALDESCPETVDVEWLEDLEGETAVAGLRPAPDGPDVIDAEWLPRPEAAEHLIDGLYVLSKSGQRASGWGADRVIMNLPVPLEVPLGSFFQGNRHLTRWLFERVAVLAGTSPTPVWDLHAGVGLLAAATRWAADRPLQLVEPHRPAARAARRNLPGARVAAGRTAEAFLARARNLTREALVITDPPRAGLSPDLRRRLGGWHPDRILTLACEPVTWARDTEFLIDRGYRLDHVELVDLFPSTHHIEILATLEPA